MITIADMTWSAERNIGVVQIKAVMHGNYRMTVINLIFDVLSWDILISALKEAKFSMNI